MGRKGSEVSPSKRYPLRSTHSGGRVLRSASSKNNTTCNEALNDSPAAQPAARNSKSGSSSGSPNNSVRVLRSAAKNKIDAFSESLNDSIAGEPDANKRKGFRPSKASSPINSVRVLRSALKNKDDACDEPLNGTPTSEQAANARECVTPSKVGNHNNVVRVLRSASKGKNKTYSEPLNDNTVAQSSMKKRKISSPLKMGSPVNSARVLRSNSKRTNETFNEPLNDSTAAQPASRKRKSDTPSEAGSPKLGVRVLRSASKKKDACVGPLNVSTPVQPAVRKRKGGNSSKERSPKKDYLKICQRVRYILNRMSYEQSLIQAYAGEGWKGQSLEKIRPEKELERAKAEIVRCKLKIREAFRNMDLLLSEGKHEESLFDSAGEIFSEDIFCAICGSKDVTLQNDILLCDGACDRGFHQNCLNPPLLTEDIPPGEEGWFCPACVCKIDCINALNELQGSKLSVHDSWEKVFPEAASFANGSKQLDASDLPLADLEGTDYNPALAEGRIVNEAKSSTKNDVDDLGLPSEDSEDDDFDPAGPDSSEEQISKSHSEESDFTSDSDDFCAEIAKSCGQGEVSASPLSNINEENWKHAFMETELDQDVVLPVSSRRQVVRLDYKKLYDEAYGEESSTSSDDEEWSGKEKLEDSETDGSVHTAKRRSRRASVGHPVIQHTPQSERHYGYVSEQQTNFFCSNGSSSSARRFGPIIKQKLKDHFEKDPYPSRATKETLAKELQLTFIQVDKWFGSTRHSSRVAVAKKEKYTGNRTTAKNDGTAIHNSQARGHNELVLALPAERSDMVHEEVTVQNNLGGENKEDVLLSGADTETDGKESSDPSDDKEWSGTSASQKEVEDIETDSLAAANCAKRLARRAPIAVEIQNNVHTPQSERLHGSVNEQQTEAPFSYGSSSKAHKYHFGPTITQKLKVHFEKDPYPSRSTVESLAQELGLTSTQVHRWFSSTRHYSSFSAAKKGKDPGKHTNEKSDATIADSIRGNESSNQVMENLNKDRDDMVSPKLMLQINLNEGNNDDSMLSQHPSCEDTIITTPTAISREADPPGYRPGENLDIGALWNTGFEQGPILAPTTVSREVGPPGYGPGENQGFCASWNATTTTMPILREVGPPGYGPRENQGNNGSWDTCSEHRVIMTPATSSREAFPLGYGQGNSASWDTSSEQRVIRTPTTSSREACAPGYGPGEDHVYGALWNTSSEQRVDTVSSTILRQVGPPGYGPGGNQVSGASWNTGTEKRVAAIPSTIPIEYQLRSEGASWNTSSEQMVDTVSSTISRQVGPPGYGPGGNQVSGASWNTGTEKRVAAIPSTIPIEVGPPGYWPGESQSNTSSWNNSCQESVFMTPTTTLSEAGPPGYWPRENKSNGASPNAGNPKGRSAEKPEIVDDARKKAIARELRRMKKFR